MSVTSMSADPPLSLASQLPQVSLCVRRMWAYLLATGAFACSCGLQLVTHGCLIQSRHPCRAIPTPNLPSG
ncbi:hypothetical protein C1893_14080 [Pseudomonas sp. MPR-ANC1]|nr:hypothetical protein C1893_14080 [Pseudomonas sp. MPR-ANC1]